MMKVISLLVVAFFLFCSCQGCSLYATNFRVENIEYPLGIDAAHPRLSWWLIPSNSTCRNLNQVAYQVLVASSQELLDKDEGDYWDSNEVYSNDTINVIYRGRLVPSKTLVYWKVIIWDSNKNIWNPRNHSEYGWWETPLLDSKDWTGKWIQRYYAPNTIPDPNKPCEWYTANDPAPLFRKNFVLDKNIARARLYITGLGYYEAFINGKKVGNNVLDPGLTTYNQTILYTTYDIGDLVQTGNNTIGVILGNGWYNPLPMLMFKQDLRQTMSTGFPSTFLAQISIDFFDGSVYTIATDTTWQVGLGPLLFNNIYLGEVYNASLEIPGWTTPAYDSSSWPQAVYSSQNGNNSRLVAQYAPPIRMFGPLETAGRWMVDNRTLVVDLGRNFAGWIQLNVTGGVFNQSIFMKYGEITFPNGSVNGLTTVAAQIKWPDAGGPCAPVPAYQTDTFILKGLHPPLVETYQQMFTWHAFRFVEFTTDSWNSLPEISVYGIPLHSDLPQIANFECSNTLFNSIQQMVVNTILSNVFSIQSDCPGRERFGYGGDAHASDKMVMLNFDMSNFYRKRVLDYFDSSNYIELRYGYKNIMPETAPVIGFHDGTMGNLSGPIGWGTMFPQMQWELYRFTGDTTLLESMFSKTVGWVEFLTQYANQNNNSINVGLGDWLGIDPPNVNFSSNVFYRFNYVLLSEIAGVLGFRDDQIKYERMAEQIRLKINSDFILSPATYDNGGQAAQSFALWHDVVNEGYEEAVFSKLVTAVSEQDYHLSTGMFSILYMLETLSSMGRSDLAFDMMNQTTYPGYGYMIMNGSTTVWESWWFSNDTYSHNHVMFGSVSAWFIEYIAGISQTRESVAFNSISIEPQVVGDLEWARGSYASVRGLISTDWNVKNNTFCLETTIPPNTQATVFIPYKFNNIKLDPESAKIFESGTPISEISEIENLHFCEQKFAQVVRVGSGTYEFCVRE